MMLNISVCSLHFFVSKDESLQVLGFDNVIKYQFLLESSKVSNSKSCFVTQDPYFWKKTKGEKKQKENNLK